MSNFPFVCATILVLFLCIFPAFLIFLGTRGGTDADREPAALELDETLVILVTGTTRTRTRLADMTSLANTLRHEDDLYWIVVENDTDKGSVLETAVKRANRPYSLIMKRSSNNSEWTLRNEGLAYIRNNSEAIVKDYANAVVYFGNGDYAYDIKFWDVFVKKVKKVGIWEVGRPYDRDTWNRGTKEGFRFFDLANFAVNLNLLLQSEALFNADCKLSAVELCFLKDLKLQKGDVEYFPNQEPLEYLVWHAPRDDPTAPQPPMELVDFVTN